MKCTAFLVVTRHGLMATQAQIFSLMFLLGAKASFGRHTYANCFNEALTCRFLLFRTSNLRFLMFAGGAGGLAFDLVGLRSLKSAERPCSSLDLAERPRRDEAETERRAFVLFVCRSIGRTECRVAWLAQTCNLLPKFKFFCCTPPKFYFRKLMAGLKRSNQCPDSMVDFHRLLSSQSNPPSL